MPVWYMAQTTPAAMLVFMAGALGFLLAVLLGRRARMPSEVGGTRDRSSFAGVAVQALGIFMASGPSLMTGSAWAGGLVSLRTLFTGWTIAASVGLFCWASRTMGANWSIVARVRSEHELVTGGPFAWVRHPIYLGMLLFLLSLAIATGHERALPFAVPVFVIGTLMRTTREEKLLRARFGAAYDQYAQQVKRFIPGVL
jgi:protein-S-isoprenylcysteine O-methyltransferase Ste14